MKPVTDPSILEQLNEPVTDPAILAQLEGESEGQDFDFSVKETISNIPGSAVEFGKSVITPFLHPIDTGKAMIDLAGSGVDRLSEMTVNALPEGVVRAGNKFNNFLVDLGIPLDRLPEGKDIDFEHTEKINQVGNFIADRYGSMQGFQKTLQTDPVGVLSDLSMLVTGGATAGATLPGKLGKVAGAAQQVGKAIEPINLAKGVAKTAASKMVPKKTPVELFESSAKFSTTFPKKKRQQMAGTALEFGLMPTAAGVDKLGGIIGDFNNKITGLIDDATEAGKTIPKKAVFVHLKQLRQKLGGPKMEASTDLAQIDKVAKTLDEHLKRLKKSRLTPSELQDLKTDAYKRVNFDAKQLQSGVGTEAARKAVARGAKEAIEKVADVKDLNKVLGQLLELEKPLSRSAARIENRNVIGIDAPIKIGAGQAAGGTAGAVAGTGMSLLEHPKIKAKLAIKLYEIQKAGKLNMIDHNLLPTLVHYGLLQAGRVTELPPTDEE